MKSISINSFRITSGLLNEISHYICDTSKLINAGRVILPCSLNDFFWASKDQKFEDAYRKVDIFLPDGMPLVWKARQQGAITDRIYGPSLMWTVLKELSKTDSRHVFYGSGENTLKRLRMKFHEHFPSLSNCLWISPPFRDLTATEEMDYLKKIQDFMPSYLWIGISSPKQVLLAAHWKQIFSRTTIVCVGAAFDLIAGVKPQAPKWIQNAGLEWAFRLSTEPKRLGRRYLVDIPWYLTKKIISTS